jgi:hypothetical protein
MHFAFAPEAVMAFAGGTSVVVESCVETEDCLAAWSGAPARIRRMVLYPTLESEFIMFLP